MASYANPELRERLASEYVLGTLRGQARTRFQSLLKYDGALRHTVAEWESRLTPMAAAAAEIEPPARLWRRIAARIGGRRARSSWWASLAFWRTFAATSLTAVLALGIYVGMLPRPEPPIAMVAVMSDDKARPAMVVSWPQLKDARDPHLRVHIVQDQPAMAPGTSWQLWVLPRGKAAPIPLALVGVEPIQHIRLPRSLTKNVWQAWGIALSVEPKGGSPTGAPTGPVIFQGRCVKVM
jgi:anti-sigma-K factor RskA